MSHTTDWDGTLLDQPRVTVVVVCTPEDESPDGRLMHCVHSIENQTYPREQVDVHIVRNVDETAVRTMQRFGVQQADTPLVAFIDVDQEWPPHVLASLVKGLEGCDTFGQLESGDGYGMIAKRSYWLEHG